MPDLNVSVTLETSDNTPEQVPEKRAERRLTLITCALVATWWTGPSQRRLFSSVKVHEDNYEWWMNGIFSGSKTHLLERTCSLSHQRRRRSESRCMHRTPENTFRPCPIFEASCCTIPGLNTPAKTSFVPVFRHSVKLSHISPSRLSPRHSARS